MAAESINSATTGNDSAAVNPRAQEGRVMSSAAKPLVIDDQEQGLFRVNRRAFTDRAIIEQE